MIATLAEWLFGCSHRHTSFPFTRRAGAVGRRCEPGKETYVVCLDCGKRFAYDWAAMRVTKQTKPASGRLVGRRSGRSKASFPAVLMEAGRTGRVTAKG